MTSETNNDSIFGQFAFDQGLCSSEEVALSREQLKARRKDEPLTLEELMINLGYLTQTQAERLKSSIKESKAAVQQIPGYKIISKLGAGAMAIVYKAKQISLNRTVAIKVLPKRFTENPEYIERFYKEGQAAAKMNHNNIVQAIDVGEAGGYHYFVMEYVEGKSIYDDLAVGKVFSETEALDIIIQLARALAHAHERGLIHRDVKPKNIMITPSGVVKLADMGLARETTDLDAAKSEEGKAYGTPYYIAPEQIRGEMDIDGRADIYSLGATFYHMVTGRLPFIADAPSDVMRKHLKEPLIPPDHINTALSAGTSEVIEIMMAKKKADRYENAKELLVDLEAIMNGQSPPRAGEKFDYNSLEKLEDGELVEDPDEYEDDNTLTNYKTAVAILSVALAILLIAVIIMFVK